jgi:hypothetical protein
LTEEVVKTLVEALAAASLSINDLKDPTKTTSVPFPYPGADAGGQSERIQVGKDGAFSFMGREAVEELTDKVAAGQKPHLLLIGTTGFGKSHVTAAFAAVELKKYLTESKEGAKVDENKVRPTGALVSSRVLWCFCS